MTGTKNSVVNHRVRQAVAVFEGLDRVITALAALGGLDPDGPEIAVMASRERLRRSPGYRAGQAPAPNHLQGLAELVELDHGPGSNHGAAMTLELVEVGHTNGTGPVLASSGSLAQRFQSAGPAAGASLERTMEQWIPRQQAAFLVSELEAGRILFWVRIRDPQHEAQVCKALLKNSAHRVQVHDLDR